MALVIVGGPHAEPAVSAFKEAGFETRLGLDGPLPEGDVMVWVDAPSAAALLEADRRGLSYVLVHHGAGDGEEGGTYARAHHRVATAGLAPLAHRLRSRERMLVSCLAFGYKNGLPAEADWVIDCRLLDNPYWVPELKELSGTDQPVIDFVLAQPAASRLLDGLEGILRDAIPLYAGRGRSRLTVAFGCTGGRHRSVVMARELASRLADLGGVDVEAVTRDL